MTLRLLGGLTQTVADRRYQQQIPGLVVPALTDTAFVAGAAAVGALTTRYSRVIAPRSGTLVDLHVYCSVKSGLLQRVKGGVLDVGLTTTDVYTRLWEGADVAELAQTAQEWLDLGDPNISVSAGQHLMFAIASEDATFQMGRQVATNANAARLPSGMITLPTGSMTGAAVFASSQTPGSFSVPATVSQSAMLSGITASIPVLTARIT